jgi:hypothetical protein
MLNLATRNPGDSRCHNVHILWARNEVGAFPWTSASHNQEKVQPERN